MSYEIITTLHNITNNATTNTQLDFILLILTVEPLENNLKIKKENKLIEGADSAPPPGDKQGMDCKSQNKVVENV